MVYDGDLNLASLHMQISKQELEESFLQATPKPVTKATPNKQEERQLIHELVKNEQQPKVDLMAKPFSGLEVTNQIYGNSSIMKTNKSLDDDEMIHLNTKVIMNSTVSNSNEDKSRSILDKLFGSSQTVNTSANLKEVILFLMIFLLVPVALCLFLILKQNQLDHRKSISNRGIL